MTIDIIGAGIGGLTAAIALNQKGFKTRIFDQSSELKPIGAGIVIANNAMQVYEKLQIRKDIEKLGNPISAMNMTDKKLRLITKTDLTYFEKKFGVKNIAIHRAKLQSLLASKLSPETEIILSHRLQSIKENEGKLTLIFENGNTYESDLLVGADGLNSKVRALLFPDSEIRNSQHVCWRGVTEYDIPEEFQNEINVAYGSGVRFGFSKMHDNQVNWFAVKSIKSDPQYHTEQLDSYYKGFHPIIQEIIGSTPKDKVHTDVLKDLAPMESWTRGNVCLLGDAAHATTPNLGQGACQAIEDAYILAQCLTKYDTKTALARYQEIRKPKADQVTKTSWIIGDMAHWRNPLAVMVRTAFFKYMPVKVNRKNLLKIFELSSDGE